MITNTPTMSKSVILPARFDFWIQQNIIAIGETLIFDDETAHKKNSNAEKKSAAHQVGDEIEGVDDSRIQKRERKMPAAINQIKAWDESFEHIHEIDEGIRDETEEQPKMNCAQNFARA